MVDVGTRGHDTAYWALGQLQHTADHDPFTSMKHVLGLATVEHVRNLVVHLIGLQCAAAQQAHHRVRRALTHGAHAVQAFFASGAGDLVEQLDHNREANGRIQITLRNVETQTFGREAEADHHQKAQAQHDHGGVAVDETGEWFAGQHHQADGEHDRDHHHRQVFDHAHSGDHRIERENRVQYHDLRHDRPEHGVSRV